jgi:hypothetical protein
VWVNGHEWAKRQCVKAGIGFTALSNGFATCEDPDALQVICDRLGPGTINVFFQRWMSVLSVPLTDADQAAGYWWELSMRQIETSRTLVFDAPRRAPGVLRSTGRRQPRSRQAGQRRTDFTGHRGHWGRPPLVEPVYKTKVVTRGTEVTINAFFKHSRVKQYLKDGRALRIETVVNSPDDLRCHRRLAHLDELQAKARDVNARLLDTERVGQGCVFASPAFERVAQSSVTTEGRRAPALRFGDPRVMALLGALCISLNAVGFTSRSLRAQVSRLLGVVYTPSQMSYDLGRPATPERTDRTHRGHQHLPAHPGRAAGRRVLHQGPRPAATTITGCRCATGPAGLRAALRTIDRHVHGYIDDARLGSAA